MFPWNEKNRLEALRALRFTLRCISDNNDFVDGINYFSRNEPAAGHTKCAAPPIGQEVTCSFYSKNWLDIKDTNADLQGKVYYNDVDYTNKVLRVENTQHVFKFSFAFVKGAVLSVSAYGKNSETSILTTSSVASARTRFEPANTHGRNDGDLIKYEQSGATAITGLTTGASYYVIGRDTLGFQLSATKGGAVISISGGGAGNKFSAADSVNEQYGKTATMYRHMSYGLLRINRVEVWGQNIGPLSCAPESEVVCPRTNKAFGVAADTCKGSDAVCADGTTCPSAHVAWGKDAKYPKAYVARGVETTN